MTREAAALIERLCLVPHPEGGYFREVYRSPDLVALADDRARRSAVTSIFYLLCEGQHSRWHQVRSDEIWHFYAGDALELHTATRDLDVTERVTLSGLNGPGTHVHVVPAMHWQAARPLGAYSLVGCTVAPGFEFADFSFLADNPHAASLIQRLDPHQRALV
jgi:predicted cupin superfamily sugar epimerase